MRVKSLYVLLATSCLPLMTGVAFGVDGPSLPLKAGIIGLDAHALPWTKILNDPQALGELLPTVCMHASQVEYPVNVVYNGTWI